MSAPDTRHVLRATDRLAHARHLVEAIATMAETLPEGPREAVSECANTAIHRMEKVRDELDEYRARHHGGQLAELLPRWLSVRQSPVTDDSDKEDAIGKEMIAIERSILIGTPATGEDWRTQAMILAYYALDGLAEPNEDVVQRLGPPPANRDEGGAA
jgi:hypothetical protein